MKGIFVIRGILTFFGNLGGVRLTQLVVWGVH
jgi:hypothetical protein